MPGPLVQALSATQTSTKTHNANRTNSDTDGFMATMPKYEAVVVNGKAQTVSVKQVNEFDAALPTETSTDKKDIAMEGRSFIPLEFQNKIIYKKSLKMESSSQDFVVDNDGASLLGIAVDPTTQTTSVSNLNAANLVPIKLDTQAFKQATTQAIVEGWTLPRYSGQSNGINQALVPATFATNPPTSAEAATGTPTQFSVGMNFVTTMGKQVTLTVQASYIGYGLKSDTPDSTDPSKNTFIEETTPADKAHLWQIDLVDTLGIIGTPGATLPQESQFAEFDESGNLKAPITINLTEQQLSLAGSAVGDTISASTITMPGLNMQGNETISTSRPNLSDNGKASSDYVDFGLDNEGYIYALYDNGERKRIALVPTSTFENANTLSRVEGRITAYEASGSSGEAIYNFSGKGNGSRILASARALSNVDEANSMIQSIKAAKSNQQISALLKQDFDIENALTQTIRSS